MIEVGSIAQYKKELKRIEKHREKGVICDRKCWCWEQENEVKNFIGGVNCEFLMSLNHKAHKRCDNHGDYYGYVCDKCCKEREVREAKEKRQKFIIEQIEKLDLPKRFKNAEFKNFETKTDKQRQVPKRS